MSKEKQIEEMVDVIDSYIEGVDVKHWYRDELDEGLAEHLYNAGYCKQNDGEWYKIEGFPRHHFCSRCQRGNRSKPNFCPNCGTKMKIK